VLILGLDTATAVTTVALAEVDGGRCSVLVERGHVDPRRHGEVLPVQVDAVLADAGVEPGELGMVAVGTGPGAFTGLRVGLATASAMGLALGIPVHGVCTLDTLAWATGRTTPFAVATDARRRELFWALYDDAATRRGEPRVGSADAAAESTRGLTVVVPPGTPLVETLGDVTEGPPPQAAALCAVVSHRMARGLAPEPAHPRYLRRPDVTPSSGPKSVLR
jgi:tRNA threonylcarbamoyl adenosine modification protein YeaZ